jgi:hypothetical protein
MGRNDVRCNLLHEVALTSCGVYIAVKRLVRIARSPPRNRATDVRTAMLRAIDELHPRARGFSIAFADPLGAGDAPLSTDTSADGGSFLDSAPYATVIIVSRCFLLCTRESVYQTLVRTVFLAQTDAQKDLLKAHGAVVGIDGTHSTNADGT